MGKVVRIVWQDVMHWSDDITERELKAEPVALYTTWGKVIEETPDFTIIASTVGDDGRIKEATRIPASLIRETKIMEED